jgi:hypothetical protein
VPRALGFESGQVPGSKVHIMLVIVRLHGVCWKIGGVGGQGMKRQRQNKIVVSHRVDHMRPSLYPAVHLIILSHLSILVTRV